ncbi:site-specific DNA-methyltransferase [Lachnospiraceae bacterium 45-W7]
MSTNISKQKRDDLIAKIGEIRTYISSAPQDENTGNLLSYLAELEKDVNGKKYGLVFEEHREEIDEVLATHTPVLSEEKDLYIDNGGNMNFLIEGDNLASLKLLEKTHKNRIQTIYIDPPYNTGNKDFTYDDNKVDGLDGFRHSKWLSFMESRLKIAKSLLSTQGVIFISIDDNEMATLKNLCDNIFGEQNFVANVIVKSNPRGSQSTKEIASVHEYVLVYAKDISSSAIIGHKLTDDMQSEYSLSDERGQYRLLGLRQRGGFWRASERPKLFYPFYVNPENADISLTEDNEHTISVYPYQPSTGEKGTWRWSKEKVEKDGQVLIAKTVKRGANMVWDIYQKDYIASDEGIKRTKAKSLWDEKEMNYQNAANELKDLFGISPFTYAKPTYLIQRAMEMIDYSQNPYILDFFAGSGTTGHAVMKLNAEDGGNRKFILCTNNENNICRDVTYERIKRVIDKENYAASLKYYKVDYVPISERMYYEYADELLAHIRELVELENGLNFTGNAEIAIALTDEELEVFTKDTDKLAKCCKLYMGHDLLPDENQEKAIKENGIEISIIPDYYYRDLQEG